MEIILSNVDGTPIYEQIVRQIKAKIVGGELKAGEALPSMRLLAKELRISVITTKRAYEELEREGFIITQTGRGSFVAPVGVELLREEQLRAVEEHLTSSFSPSAWFNNSISIGKLRSSIGAFSTRSPTRARSSRRAAASSRSVNTSAVLSPSGRSFSSTKVSTSPEYSCRMESTDNGVSASSA